MTLTKDAWADQIGSALAAGADFRRVLARIASFPLSAQEPNFAGIGGTDAYRFVTMAREVLATHPESHTNAEKEG